MQATCLKTPHISWCWRFCEGAEKWLDADYGVMHFAPDAQGIKTGDGLPHIRLDKAVEFLIGDRL